MTDGPTLVPYDGSCAARVVDWCAASPFSREWVPAAATDPDAVLAGWHTDPDITGYLLLREGALSPTASCGSRRTRTRPSSPT